MRDLALEIVRQGSAGPSREEASDLSIDVSLPGFHEGIEDAPQNARSLRGCFAVGTCAADESPEIPAVCRVAHDHLFCLRSSKLFLVRQKDMVLRMSAYKRYPLSG